MPLSEPKRIILTATGLTVLFAVAVFTMFLPLQVSLPETAIIAGAAVIGAGFWWFISGEQASRFLAAVHIAALNSEEADQYITKSTEGSRMCKICGDCYAPSLAGGR